MSVYLLMGWGICSPALSQLDTVLVEVFYVDDATVSGYPAGATTYRIFAQLADAEDRLSAIYAAEEHPLALGTTDGSSIWNSTFGGVTGPELNPAFFGTFPSLLYDSYVTVGREDADAIGGGINYISLLPNEDAFAPVFGTDEIWGADLLLDDGAWFGLPTDDNTLGQGPEFEVLLAQITTSSDLYFNLNVQVLDGGTGGIIQQYVWDPTLLDVPDDEVDGSQLGLSYNSDVEVDCSEIAFTAALSCEWDPDENLVVNTYTGMQTAAQGCVVDSIVWVNVLDLLDVHTWDPSAAVDLSTGIAFDVSNLLMPLTEGQTYTITPWFPEGEGSAISGISSESALVCQEVFGCTEVTSCNYDPSATADDYSCSTNTNNTVEESIQLHVYPTNEYVNVSHSFKCTTAEQGLYYCFRATSAPVRIQAFSTVSFIDFEVIDGGGEVLFSSFDAEPSMSLAVQIPDLINEETYTLRFIQEEIPLLGPSVLSIRMDSDDGSTFLADLDGDGFLSSTDIIAFLGSFGSASDLGDFDFNGFVDTADLLTLIYLVFTASSCN